MFTEANLTEKSQKQNFLQDSRNSRSKQKSNGRQCINFTNNEFDSASYLRGIGKNVDQTKFKEFYYFVFRYHLLKPGQKVLELESAIVLINIVVVKIFPIAEKFVKFLRATDKKVINKDQWNNMIEVFPILQNGGTYDASGACISYKIINIGPTIFDEFYSWIQTNS